jgi:regulator of protease activity HflC (stomatin/prohibitin superfamily)
MAATSLVQIVTSKGIGVSEAFSNVRTDGSLPIIAVPKTQRRWYETKLSIPEEAHVLLQESGLPVVVATGGATGLKVGSNWASGSTRVVAYVTKQLFPFHVLGIRTFTKDFISCQLDAKVTLDVTDAAAFFYTLGAHALTMLLQTIVPEEVRALVRQMAHDKLSATMLGPSSQTLLDIWNDQLRPHGIQAKQLSFTCLWLQKSLVEITDAKSIHEIKLHQLQLKHELELAALARETEGKKTIYKSKADAVALGRRFERASEEARIQREHQEKLRAQAKALIEVERRCTMALEAARNQTHIRKMNAQARVVIAQHKATTSMIQAEAEVQVSDALVEVRGHRAELAEINALRELASKARVSMSGPARDRLLRAVLAGEPLAAAAKPWVTTNEHQARMADIPLPEDDEGDRYTPTLPKLSTELDQYLASLPSVTPVISHTGSPRTASSSPYPSTKILDDASGVGNLESSRAAASSAASVSSSGPASPSQGKDDNEWVSGWEVFNKKTNKYVFVYQPPETKTGARD